MASHGDFSPEARERADRTVSVAAVFAANAPAIVAALPDVPAGHVLVAVVDDDHEFSGTHHVEQATLVERVPELEAGGGWAMVFTPGTTEEEVRRRSAEMGVIAQKRADTIDRIVARRNANPSA
jgi:hypothetical protein